MKKRVVDSAWVSAEEFPWGRIKWLHNAATGAEGLTFGEVVILPGCENPVHAHPNCEEVLYLLSGELVHTCGDEAPHVLNRGMAICIPGGSKHNARCTSEEPARMLVAYDSARREVTNE